MSRYEPSNEKFLTANTFVLVFGKGEKPRLEDNQGNVLNRRLVFYEGRFLLYDQQTERLVTLSYTSPQKEEFILRSLSADGSLVWVIRQSKMEVGNLLKVKPGFERAFVYGSNLIFLFNGFSFSLDSENGSLNWVTFT